ncbi:MAG TPA: heparan-alpha-glucosaminide N-acetyltransferase domain-containing protein [Polyangiales bacterium]|nr:heparan-alpha-glucosaminide N-acetyltransferase domain-containing protein [Polyangiales bacterium]
MSTKAQAASRLASIDVLRGVGVVLMVQLHTSHGWIAPDARSGAAWAASQFWGGLAAPIFLMLAGVSIGLQWAGSVARGTQPSLGRALRRALQLVVLGYVLRLQMWFIDAGGWARTEAYLAQVLLAAAYALTLVTLAQAQWRPLLRAACYGAAAASFAAGLWQVAAHAPDRLAGLLRVDVLQCIGGSLALVIAFAAACGSRVTGAAGQRRRPIISGRVARIAREPFGYALVSCAIAFITIWTRSWVPGPLPAPIAAYLGQWQPEPGKSIIGLFPLFPWAAYTFAGTAFGLHWGRQARDVLLRRLLLLGLVALLLALSTRESGTLAHLLIDPFPALTQPLRVMQRVAWVLALGGVCAACTAWLPAIVAPLDVLGRASLLIYWVHLEFAFGAASSAFSKSLGITPWAIGSAGLVIAMWLVAQIRLGLGASRQREADGSPDEPSVPRERTRSA